MPKLVEILAKPGASSTPTIMVKLAMHSKVKQQQRDGFSFYGCSVERNRWHTKEHDVLNQKNPHLCVQQINKMWHQAYTKS